jgi:hypothetical protein
MLPFFDCIYYTKLPLPFKEPSMRRELSPSNRGPSEQNRGPTLERGRRLIESQVYYAQIRAGAHGRIGPQVQVNAQGGNDGIFSRSNSADLTSQPPRAAVTTPDNTANLNNNAEQRVPIPRTRSGGSSDTQSVTITPSISPGRSRSSSVDSIEVVNHVPFAGGPVTNQAPVQQQPVSRRERRIPVRTVHKVDGGQDTYTTYDTKTP